MAIDMGDLGELTASVSAGGDAGGTQRPEREAVVDAAADGLAGLLVHMGSMQDRRRRVAGERDAARARATDAERRASVAEPRMAAAEARAATAEATVREHRELPPIERVKRTVVELGGQWPVLGALLRGWRATKRFLPTRG